MDLMVQLTPDRIQQMHETNQWQQYTVLDSFDNAVKNSPTKTALISHQTGETELSSLTYAELDAAVTRIALTLADAGVNKGDVVSWQLPNWWQFTAIHLACLRIGAISNPMMHIFRQRELRFMLTMAESKVLIVPRVFRGFDHAAMAEELRPELPALSQVYVIGDAPQGPFGDMRSPLTEQQKADAGKLFAARRLGADEVIQLMYTSGTTGEPKGVMHTSNTLLAHLRPSIQRLGLTSSEIVLCPTPLAHQLGFLYGLMLPLVLGSTVVLMDIWNPQIGARLLGQHQVTFAMGSTPFLADLTNFPGLPETDVSSLRLFFSAGAPIPRQLVQDATTRLGARIISAWGMTENGAPTMAKPDDPAEKIFNTDGSELDGMQVRVIDELGQPVAVGEEGKLQVRGASNFVGYLKRPELYGIDGEGWFNTGDLARKDAQGYIRISGRAKDVIIRGGENIPVVEVEELLFRHPAIAAAAVVAMPDERLGERACAFVQLRPGATLDFSGLIAYLAEQKMARAYFPERLEIVPELPRTPSGKLQKFLLRDRAKGMVPQTQSQG